MLKQVLVHRMLMCLTIGTLMAGCSSTPNLAAPTPTLSVSYKIGVVLDTNGTIHDGTFNELAYNGAVRAAHDFNLPDVIYKTPVQDKDYPIDFDKMVSDGRNIIVTAGFSIQDATVAAAKKYPNVYFVGIDEAPDPLPPNFISVIFKEDQGGFLAGALAGMMTKTGTIGVIGGPKVPQIVRFVNGFTAGAKYVNAKANPVAVYVDSFNDSAQGRSAAENLIGQKADVIFNAAGLTGSSGIARAAELKSYVIGVDQDEFRTTFTSGKDADYVLTSALKRTDSGVYIAINKIINGKAQDNKLLLGTTECGITFASFHNTDKVIPADVKTLMENVWRALAGGTLATSADGSGTATLTPLPPGSQPPVSSTAPTLDSCQRN